MKRSSAWWRLGGAVLVLAAGLFLTVVPGVQAASPTEDIRSSIDEVLSILNNAALQGPAHREQRLAQVEKVAARRFDYREMAKRSLREDWDSLSKTQQDEFVQLFTDLFKGFYSCRLDELASAKVTYQPEINKGEEAEVPVVVLRPNDKIPVNFRVLHSPQGWRIYDLTIEGVSLADNFHSQFARIIAGGSFRDLVRLLQDKWKEENKP